MPKVEESAFSANHYLLKQGAQGQRVGQGFGAVFVEGINRRRDRFSACGFPQAENKTSVKDYMSNSRGVTVLTSSSRCISSITCWGIDTLVFRKMMFMVPVSSCPTCI